MRKCTRCGLVKDDPEFSWKARNERRSPVCKICQRAWRIAHYANNTKHIEKRAVKRRVRDLRAWLSTIKSDLGCVKCGETHPAALDFHHLEPDKKEITASHIISVKGHGKARILDEIRKCVVLCSNCHRKFHHSERQKLTAIPDYGERKPRVQLIEAEVASIRQMIAEGENNTQIGRQFGVSHSTVSSIRRGKTWKNIGR